MIKLSSDSWELTLNVAINRITSRGHHDDMKTIQKEMVCINRDQVKKLTKREIWLILCAEISPYRKIDTVGNTKNGYISEQKQYFEGMLTFRHFQ